MEKDLSQRIVQMEDEMKQAQKAVSDDSKFLKDFDKQEKDTRKTSECKTKNKEQ